MAETQDENADTVTPSSPPARLREFAPHPYQSLNSDGEILTVNEAWLDKLGYDREEVEGHWFGELLANDSVDKFESRFAEFKSAGGVSNVEFEMQSADGDVIAVSFDGTIECDEDGAFVRTHCQFTDITERKEHLQDLKRQKTFIDNTPVAVAVLDENGEITYHSKGSEEIVGLAPDELMGQTAFEFIHPDDRTDVVEQFSSLFEDPGGSRTAEYRLEDDDGNWRWVQSKAINYLNEPAIEGIVLAEIDITERKEREEALQRERDRLDEFASVVSHDLRNPLNVAQGRIDLAQEECDTEHLDAAARGVDRSLDLIDDMLELARAGQAVSETEPVEVADLADVCWDTVETADAEIRVDLNSTIQADRSRLRQLLENLFRNAIEHGREDVTVRIGSLPEGFYVEDDGPEIPHDEREKVWESGYSESDDGTGFGLAIVKQIVEAHGWDIRITDGSEGGARFEITRVEVVAE
jgi:PAS domain S-box-containing protein